MARVESPVLTPYDGSMAMIVPLVRRARRIGSRATLFALIGLVAACGRSDSRLETAVRARLADDPATAPLTLAIEARDGMVHLSGAAASRHQRERAIDIARGVIGVSGVTSDVTISDDLLAELVRQTLAADPELANVPMDVDSANGVVRLMSDATNREQRERAITLATQVDGVERVEDRMK